jgi:hypothetical protein
MVRLAPSHPGAVHRATYYGIPIVAALDKQIGAAVSALRIVRSSDLVEGLADGR